MGRFNARPGGAIRRLVGGAAAFIVGDLVVGMVAFSVIALASLWYFSLGWIKLAGEYSAVGLPFGSSGQLSMAWIGAIGALPALIAVIYLATRALRLPHSVFRYTAGLRGPHPPRIVHTAIGRRSAFAALRDQLRSVPLGASAQASMYSMLISHSYDEPEARS